MNHKKLLASAMFILCLTALTNVGFAAKVEQKPDADLAADSAKKLTDPSCVYEVPKEEESILAEFITVRNKLRVEEGDDFRVKVFLKNTGNTPWFSSNSTCSGNKISLGTDKERNRNSRFYSKIKEDDNNWEAKNRVGMDQEIVKPGEIASFTFWSEAGDDAEVYKEYFTPVVNNSVWLDNSQFSFYVMVGDTGEDKSDIRKKMLYASVSGRVSDVNLDGEKKLLVDLSEQKLYITLDNNVVREFRVSTGAWKTPTPKGEYSIKLKQDVRISGKTPHYIMPKFMWFRDGGYGFHALPSLRTDGGRFWTEAREHIGTPVSHGCIRLLPEDADFAFEFSELGTKVEIQG